MSYRFPYTTSPMIWYGEWSAQIQYNPGAIVTYSGSTYVALLVNSNITPEVGAMWASIGSGGEPPTTVTFNATELSTLADTPLELVPAPGAGEFFSLTKVVRSLKLNGASAFNIEESVLVNAGDVVLATLINTTLLADSMGNAELFPYVGKVADALTLTSGVNPILPGVLVTSALNAGGSLWRPGDGFVSAGGVVGTVDTVDNSFPITGVSTVGKTFTIAGDHSAMTGPIQVYRSTGNDNAAYTLASAIFGAGSTVVTVLEAVPDATVDGFLGDANAAVGPILTYTITNPGTDAVKGTGVDIRATGAWLGNNAGINRPGVNYVPTDTFKLTDSVYTADAEFEVDTVDGNGGIVTFHCTNPGTNVTLGHKEFVPTSGNGSDGNFDGNNTISNTGTGATIDITDIDLTNNLTTLTVKTYHTVEDA